MIRTLRPHQWVKNLFVMAPMFFHKALFLHSDAGVQINWIVFGRAMAATFVFCLLAGAVYTINDIVDADAESATDWKRPPTGPPTSYERSLGNQGSA